MLLQVILSTDRRGSEVFAMDLAAALGADGREVRTVALARRHTGAQLPVAVLGDRKLGISTLAALRKEVRRASVVIAHGSSTLPACAAATAATGVPFVYRSIGDPTYWAATPARRVRSGVLLHQASAVVALWQGAANSIARLFRVPQRKLHVIPNGVPSERFPLVDEQRRAAARQKFGIAPSTPAVLYMGSLTDEKDVATAISAMASVPRACLLISGDGPARASLMSLAEGSGGQVRFLGSTSEPATVMAVADAIVLPSRTEGIPAVLIEAGLSGIPAVATDVGGVKEIIQHGTSGLLVPPGNIEALAGAIRTILIEPDVLGIAARHRCLFQFDMKVVSRQWAELVDRVSHSAPGSGRTARQKDVPELEDAEEQSPKGRRDGHLRRWR